MSYRIAVPEILVGINLVVKNIGRFKFGGLVRDHCTYNYMRVRKFNIGRDFGGCKPPNYQI